MKEVVVLFIGKLGEVVVVSIVVGFDLFMLVCFFGGYCKIVCCMFNMLVLIGVGIIGLCLLFEVSSEECVVVDCVLSVVGSMVWIDDENKMDGVMVFFGSGLVYVFLFIEVL